jgi:hypothetical protein
MHRQPSPLQQHGGTDKGTHGNSSVSLEAMPREVARNTERKTVDREIEREGSREEEFSLACQAERAGKLTGSGYRS